MSMNYRTLACAALALGVSAVAQAHNDAAANTATQGLTREQVLEDLQQWHASGMTFVPHPSGYSDAAQSPEYQRYLQQRQAAAQAKAVEADVAQTAASEAPTKQP